MSITFLQEYAFFWVKNKKFEFHTMKKTKKICTLPKSLNKHINKRLLV